MPKPDTTFVEFMAEVHTDLCDFAYPIGMIPDTRHAGELSALLADRQCGSACVMPSKRRTPSIASSCGSACLDRSRADHGIPNITSPKTSEGCGSKGSETLVWSQIVT
jgi:hypothetical protein